MEMIATQTKEIKGLVSQLETKMQSMNTNNLLSMSKGSGEGGDDSSAIQAAMLQNVNQTAAANAAMAAVPTGLPSAPTANPLGSPTLDANRFYNFGRPSMLRFSKTRMHELPHSKFMEMPTITRPMPHSKFGPNTKPHTNLAD
jgi:hypothetical protein